MFRFRSARRVPQCARCLRLYDLTCFAFFFIKFCARSTETRPTNKCGSEWEAVTSRDLVRVLLPPALRLRRTSVWRITALALLSIFLHIRNWPSARKWSGDVASTRSLFYFYYEAARFLDNASGIVAFNSSIRVEGRLASPRRQWGVVFFSFNIPHHGNSCFTFFVRICEHLKEFVPIDAIGIL